MKRLAFVLLVAVLMSACQNSGDGQLVGVQDRPEFLDLTPFGMVYIPAGHYTMGSGDQDVPYATTNQSKSVTVVAMWMDETEITNNEYRQFVEWVKDSIAHCLLGDLEGEEIRGKYGHYLRYDKNNAYGDNEEGTIIEPKLINWDEEIPWDSQDAEQIEALSPLFNKVNTRYYHYRPNKMNISMINFEYWTMDLS